MTSPTPGRSRSPLTVKLAAFAAVLAVPALLMAQQPQTSAAQAAAPAAPAAPAKAAHSAGKAGKTDKKDDTSYSLGVSMGEQLKRAQVTPEMINSAKLAQGVREALAGKATLTPADQTGAADDRR